MGKKPGVSTNNVTTISKDGNRPQPIGTRQSLATSLYQTGKGKAGLYQTEELSHPLTSFQFLEIATCTPGRRCYGHVLRHFAPTTPAQRPTQNIVQDLPGNTGCHSKLAKPDLKKFYTSPCVHSSHWSAPVLGPQARSLLYQLSPISLLAFVCVLSSVPC